MARHLIEGHAIVSVEGAIADAAGRVPDSLRNEADWALFQSRLDASALTVLGRLGHEANPNAMRRRRLVLSRGVEGLVREDDITFRLNPDTIPIGEALARLVPAGGRIAVVGGTGVFDAFLPIGYDTFWLAVATRARVPGGRPVFTGIASVAEAEARLVEMGLVVRARSILDMRDGIELAVFRRDR